METIKEILGKVVGDIEQRRNLQDDIETLWNRAAHKRFSKHTKAQRLKGSTLYINVENSTWLYALRMQRNRIEKALQRLSEKKITHMSARVGDIYGQR